MDLMNNSRADFPSRVGVRAVASGIIVSVALMIFFMSPAGHFDLQGRGLLDNTPGTGFWVSAGIAWAVSVFIGALLASRVSRSQSMTDGLIHGLVVWAGAYLAFGGFAFLAIGLESPFGSPAGHSRLVLGGFVSDTIGLVTAMLGGLFGARWERHVHAPVVTTEVKSEAKSETRLRERRPEEPSPAPT